MTQYGFFSKQQSNNTGTVFYLTPKGDKAEVSEVLDDMTREEAIKYYMNRFPDGRFVGKVTQYLRRGYCGTMVSPTGFLRSGQVKTLRDKKYGFYSKEQKEIWGSASYSSASKGNIEVTEVSERPESEYAQIHQKRWSDSISLGEVLEYKGEGQSGPNDDLPDIHLSKHELWVQEMKAPKLEYVD